MDQEQKIERRKRLCASVEQALAGMNRQKRLTKAEKQEIVRILGNRLFEQHPTRSDSAGMAELGSILPLMLRASASEMRSYLSEYRKVLDKNRKCAPCYGKLCTYGILFCGDKFVRDRAGFRRRLNTLIKWMQPCLDWNRDLEAEVWEHLLETLN